MCDFAVLNSLENKFAQAQEWMNSQNIRQPRVKISSMHELHKYRTPSVHKDGFMTFQECRFCE